MLDATGGSYDDLPETDVATVLAVPLLWGPTTESPSTAPAPTPTRTQSSASASAPARPIRRARAQPTRAAQPIVISHGRHRRSAHGTLASVVATARVGLVSASIVVAAFALVLAALTYWQP